jgi:hypothetical protein
MKNCSPLWREARLEVNMQKQFHARITSVSGFLTLWVASVAIRMTWQHLV